MPAVSTGTRRRPATPTTPPGCIRRTVPTMSATEVREVVGEAPVEALAEVLNEHVEEVEERLDDADLLRPERDVCPG